MDQASLEKNPLILDWFANIEAVPNTRRNYLRGTQLYTDFTRKTPEELLEEAEAEIKNGILMRKRNIRKHLLEFREMLKAQKIAPKTLHNHMTAVKSFYKSFDIDLPKLNARKQYQALPTEKNDLRLEKEDIQRALKYANVRSRAIILTMASSGLSQSDVLDLTVGDFKRGLDEETMITTLELRRNKTNYDFVTFLSPEATKAVLEYLEYRNRKPKDNQHPQLLIAWDKRRVRSDKDYLFCKHDIPGSYLKILNEEERKLNPQGVMDIFRELAKRSGLDTERGQWQVFRAHNLRKYFNNTLLNNGADIFFADFLMGHKVDQTHEAYFRASPKKLKERYMRYLPFLTLTDTEVHVIETEEYAQLKAENEGFKRQIQEIRKELDTRRDTDKLLDSIFTDAKIRELIKEKMKELSR